MPKGLSSSFWGVALFSLLAVACRAEVVVGMLTLFTVPLSKMIMRHHISEFSGDQEEVKNAILHSSYLSQTYKLWIESVGMRVVALDINQSDEELAAQLDRLDGLVLTGGREQFYQKPNGAVEELAGDQLFAQNQTAAANATENTVELDKIPTEYLLKVDVLVKKAKQINDQRRIFPIWATCLGFEALLITDSKYTLMRHQVDNEMRAPRPIDIASNSSRIVNFFSQQELDAMENFNIFYFNHKYGLFVEDIVNNQYLQSQVQVVATIRKRRHQVVAMFEYKDYPFLGSQFHPEKFEKPTEKGTWSENFWRLDINRKMALLFESFVKKDGGYVGGSQGRLVNRDYESSGSRFDLHNVGMYDHIILFVNKTDIAGTVSTGI